jgi:enterochelin esterase-like enzyme
VCGTADPFYSRVRKFAALPHDPAIVTYYSKGGHDPAYWRSNAVDQLTFLGSRRELEAA